MKNREGFTLAELVLSVFIFSFIAASLATIVSTTHRHMFQNYRKNIIKTNVLLSMKAIQKNLSVATRVDLPTRAVPPAAPAITDSGKVLAFATNVDQTTGCYPIVAGVQPAWHYFCHYTQVNSSCLSGSCLFYHTGPINGGGAACGNTGAATWNAVYPVGACGPAGSGTIMLLMDNVSFANPALPPGALFSRKPADGINSADTVRVALYSQWSASASGMGASQRDVDSTLDTVVKFNRSFP